MEIQMEKDRNQPVNSKRLWFSVGAGPILWAVHLLIAYAVASLPCITPVFNFTVIGMPGVRFVLMVFTLLMTVIVAVAGFMGYGIWQSLRGNDRTDDRSADPGETRFHFMAFSGILLSVLFGAAILASAGPILAFNVCSI